MTQPKTASKFTPEKWYFQDVLFQGGEGGKQLYRVVQYFDQGTLLLHEGRDEKRARLIAAGPEMYELLSQLLETVDREFLAGGTPLCDRCEQTLGQSITDARRIKAAIDGTAEHGEG